MSVADDGKVWANVKDGTKPPAETTAVLDAKRDHLKALPLAAWKSGQEWNGTINDLVGIRTESGEVGFTKAKPGTSWISLQVYVFRLCGETITGWLPIGE